jgi:hypothetical protein
VGLHHVPDHRRDRHSGRGWLLSDARLEDTMLANSATMDLRGRVESAAAKGVSAAERGRH